MAFPEYHHTELRSLHSQFRQMFADFGSYGGLNLQDDGKEVSFVPQKCHPQPGQLQYSAFHPTMPLYPSPTDVPFPYRDRISGARLERQNKLKTFLHFTLCFRWNSFRARGAWDESADLNDKCKETGRFIKESKSKLQTAIKEQDIAAEKDVLEKMKKFRWIWSHMEAYKELGNIGYVPDVNFHFTGGCLASLERGDNQLLLHPSGVDWEQVSVTSVKETDPGMVQADQLTSGQAVSSIYQLDSQYLCSTACCVARTKDGCSLWKLVDTEEATSSLTLDNRGNQSVDNISSVCLSPFIPAEVLVATSQGDALLWTPINSMEVVVKENSTRFECMEPWRQCQFGAHPRLITMTDRSMLQLFDIRTSCKTGTDIFALPSKLLHPEERIQVSCQQPSQSFYHLLATDYSLFLLDQRFPNHPVLQWYHMLSVPQYLSPANQELADGRHMTLLASQIPAETYAFQYNFSTSGIPPCSSCVPFRISCIEDFPLFPDLSGVISNMVTNRLSSSSLAGVALLNSNTSAGGFTAYQLDCHGDLFYQTYHKRALSGEITQAPGPGSTDVNLSSAVIDRCTKWLKTLEAQSDSWFRDIFATSEHVKVDASESFTAVTQQSYAHVLCPLCMPQTCRVGDIGMWEGAGEADPGSDADVCHVCSTPLAVSRAMEDALKQNTVVYEHNQEPNWDEMIPDSVDLMSCQLPLSKMLVKEWHGENNIDDLLKAQDRILQKRKEEQIKKKKEELKKSEEVTSTHRQSQESLSLSVRDQDNHTPCRTPSSSPPSTPGFGATPQRFRERGRADSLRGDRNTPPVTPTVSTSQNGCVDTMFSFVSPQRPASTPSLFTPPARRRKKKHVTGF
ncbi:uncharacterized protein LOC135473763 [Liolophura sinensis]|uniref:uncharacterized protein LOC135473763 n=1 Tax=Liolophura sinensis TaxID=3198878 RepID=UPI003157F345